MTAVVITGASGFLGRLTAARLAAAGYTVYGTCSPRSSPPDLPAVRWLPCDLAGPEPTAGWPGSLDAVLYLAQSRRWRSFPEGAGDVVQVNVAALQGAAEHARQAGARRFLMASSGTIYPETGAAAREDVAFEVGAPRSFYAASKLAAEILLRPFSRFMSVVVLRLFMPYGTGQEASMLLPTIVGKVRAGEPITLHGEQGLLANPVASGDVAETFERCLALDGSRVLNVGGPEVLSLRAMSEAIGEVLGLAPRFEVRDERAPVIVGDTAALAAALGWRPGTPFRAGLREWLGEDPTGRTAPRS
jgi:nucleoside-diphosphate-sugar epimerase